MHLAQTTGPGKTLYPRLAALTEQGPLVILAPAAGELDPDYQGLGKVTRLSYSALMIPRGPRQALSALSAFRRDVRTFRGQLRRVGPDLVVVVTTALPAALVAARRERLPTIVYSGEVLNKATRPDPVRGLGAAVLGRFTARSADAIVCASETVARQFPRSRASVVTIYPGIAPEATAPRESRFRAQNGIPAGARCIAVVGSITEARGQDVVIRALPHLRERFSEAYCLIVGEPHPRAADERYDRHLRELASTSGVADAVLFAGFVPDMGAVYAAADVVVNPTRCPEGFGRVAAEALLAGRPVVASALGALPEVLTNDVDALLVEPGDPVALARAIERLWSEPGLSERLVRSGQDRVRSAFGVEAGVEAFSQVVRDVLKRVNGRGPG
jgi:glycosyltransferase involved in cell wall biosynthesis